MAQTTHHGASTGNKGRRLVVAACVAVIGAGAVWLRNHRAPGLDHGVVHDDASAAREAPPEQAPEAPKLASTAPKPQPAGRKAPPVASADPSNTEVSDLKMPLQAKWQDAALLTPMAVERSGGLGRLFARWSQDPTDEAGTDALLEELKARLVDAEVQPSSVFGRCTETVCRVAFELDGLDELQRLGAVNPPDEGRPVVTPVEFVEGQYRVGIYWKRPGVQEVSAEVAAVFR